MQSRNTLVFAVGALLASTVGGDFARADTKKNTTIEPKAEQLLRKMTAQLSTLKSFQFDADHATEIVTKDGQKIQLLAKSRVEVQRPDKMRSDRTGPLADVGFYYDGKNVTIFGKRKNMYAVAEAPKTLDKAIDVARTELDLDAPAADLLYRDSYPTLMEDVVSGTYLGLEEVGDRACHHLAFRGNETDWQIWIEDGEKALPCRYLITSKKVKESPQFLVEFSDWKLDEKFPADTFVFTPPKDAQKIDFLRVREARKQIGKR